MPIDRLYAAQYALTQEIPQAPAKWGEIGVTMMPFGPVIDPDTLPQDPLDAIRVGRRVGGRRDARQQRRRAPLLPRPPGLIDKLSDFVVDAALRIYGAIPSRIRDGV